MVCPELVPRETSPDTPRVPVTSKVLVGAVVDPTLIWFWTIRLADPPSIEIV
jgi:hypothetical protein